MEKKRPFHIEEMLTQRLRVSPRRIFLIFFVIICTTILNWLWNHNRVNTTLEYYSHPIPIISAKFPNLVLWSSDFHISPVQDIKHLLSKFEVSIIDKSLSGHCHLTNTCERDLRILNVNNGINLNPCPNGIKREFYNSYRTDPDFLRVDAFLCLHAASLCEVFMPFKKPLIVIASTRYEIGRYQRRRWLEWNVNLRRIAANPNNVIAANNLYDLEYIKYFTGIRNVILLPSFGGYVTARYEYMFPASRPQYLIAPARGVNPELSKQLLAAAEKALVPLSHIRDLYPHFEYSDLALHPAVIIIPYQISFMTFFEMYRMVY